MSKVDWEDSLVVTVPDTMPSPMYDGKWKPKEWPIRTDGPGQGIELWVSGQWVNRQSMLSPPVGTYMLLYWELVLRCGPDTVTYLIDAVPGSRLSLPHSQIIIRPVLVAGGHDNVQFLDMAGWKVRFAWAASRNNGSRGATAVTRTMPIEGSVASNTTGARVVIPDGAKSVNVKVGTTPLSTISLREYLASDKATGIATEAVTTQNIPVSGAGGDVAVINGSAAAINVTYIWTMFL